MSKAAPTPFRQIHLDFHTGPAIPDIGAEFDARGFARALKAAHVNSVTVFAKCHHGHLYYRTRRPERHPGLRPGLDLLGGQVEALRREGIRAPIYLSVQCDEYAAEAHPEWVALRPDGGQVKWGQGVFDAGWRILDMSSPYREFLAGQTAEVLKLFKPVDGIFFDMCWDQPSCSKWALAGMRRAGLDPASEGDRARYARQVSLDYMGYFHRLVKRSSPRASVFFNCRPLFNLPEDIRFLEQVEIEALPTGGWGYIYFPRTVRYARTFPKPVIGMTARFHKSWADFGGLKPYAALEYETSQMMALGARCSVGDQLHPRGTLDAGAYAAIGRAYARVEAREPWLEGAAPVSDIGLFQLPTGDQSTTQSTSGSDEGATRLLTQLKAQFDVVGPESDLGRYRLLVLPDAVPVGEGLAGQLSRYLAGGGALLASGASGMGADGRPALRALPFRAAEASPFTTTYFRFGRRVAAGAPDSDHVIYERGWRLAPARGAETLARIVEPYFERAWDRFSSHKQTPAARLTPHPAALLKGRAAHIAFPVFSAFALHGNFPYRLLAGNILDLLLPDPVLRAEGPTGMEASVMAQARGRGRRHIVHLLFYPSERRAKDLDLIEDIVPLRDVPVSLRLGRDPARVYLAPEGRDLPFRREGGYVRVTVPEVRGHAMVVFE